VVLRNVAESWQQRADKTATCSTLAAETYGFPASESRPTPIRARRPVPTIDPATVLFRGCVSGVESCLEGAMRAVIVYESVYGNTHAAAGRVADGLRPVGEAVVVPVAFATAALLAAAGGTT
jgi:hypothetical protein